MSDGFLDLYRATVVGDVDAQCLRRVRVGVPEVLGDGQSSWAMPCVPYLNPDLGLVTIPPVGTGVWVTSERGDPDYPVWMGRYVSPGEGPGPGR